MFSVSFRLSLLCLCLLLSPSVWAQQKQHPPLSKRQLRQKLYPDLMRAFDLAEVAPAPLRALALLRIATFPANNDQEWKRELLEEAFEAASQSPLRWRVSYVAAPQGTLPPPLPKRMIKASEINNSGLDRVSLLTGIVRAMVPVDKQESVKLFNRIGPLGLSSLTCSDDLVPNVEDYYRTAEQLAKDGFTLPQRKKNEHLEFLRTLVLSMKSSVEVGPVAQMLWSEHLPPGDSSVLVAAFDQQLASLSGDCRSFFSWLGETSESAMGLADSLEGGDVVSFLKAWRAYLISNLGSVRCAETVDPKWFYPDEAAGAVRDFNRRAEQHGSVTRIEEDDIRPGRLDPGLPPERAMISEQDQELHTKWEWLMFGDQHEGLTDEQKNKAEWKSRFEEYLSAIENLESSGDSDADLLERKCDLMRAAALAAPTGPARERVLSRYAALLKISNIPPEVLPEWYTAVHSMIDFTQSIYKDRESVLKSLEATGDPLLSLIAAIHRLEPVSPAAK